MNDEIPWEDIPYAYRMAATAYVMKAICEHAEEGGSFRHLIYDRLGFDLDGYGPLYEAGGMIISNEFILGAREVTAEDKHLSKLVYDWAMGVMPAPSEERTRALNAAYRFMSALEELSKMDELIGRRVHEELTKIND